MKRYLHDKFASKVLQGSAHEELVPEWKKIAATIAVPVSRRVVLSSSDDDASEDEEDLIETRQEQALSNDSAVQDAVADLKLGVTGDERYDTVDREGEKVDVEEQEDAELGRGRFATTYRMRHSIDGRLCAVKAKRDLSSHQKRPI